MAAPAAATGPASAGPSDSAAGPAVEAPRTPLVPTVPVLAIARIFGSLTLGERYGAAVLCRTFRAAADSWTESSTRLVLTRNQAERMTDVALSKLFRLGEDRLTHVAVRCLGPGVTTETFEALRGRHNLQVLDVRGCVHLDRLWLRNIVYSMVPMVPPDVLPFHKGVWGCFDALYPGPPRHPRMVVHPADARVWCDMDFRAVCEEWAADAGCLGIAWKTEMKHTAILSHFSRLDTCKDRDDAAEKYYEGGSGKVHKAFDTVRHEHGMGYADYSFRSYLEDHDDQEVRGGEWYEEDRYLTAGTDEDGYGGRRYGGARQRRPIIQKTRAAVLEYRLEKVLMWRAKLSGASCGMCSAKLFPATGDDDWSWSLEYGPGGEAWRGENPFHVRVRSCVRCDMLLCGKSHCSQKCNACSVSVCGQGHRSGGADCVPGVSCTAADFSSLEAERYVQGEDGRAGFYAGGKDDKRYGPPYLTHCCLPLCYANVLVPENTCGKKNCKSPRCPKCRNCASLNSAWGGSEWDSEYHRGPAWWTTPGGAFTNYFPPSDGEEDDQPSGSYWDY